MRDNEFSAILFYKKYISFILGRTNFELHILKLAQDVLLISFQDTKCRQKDEAGDEVLRKMGFEGKLKNNLHSREKKILYFAYSAILFGWYQYLI